MTCMYTNATVYIHEMREAEMTLKEMAQLVLDTGASDEVYSTAITLAELITDGLVDNLTVDGRQHLQDVIDDYGTKENG